MNKHPRMKLFCIVIALFVIEISSVNGDVSSRADSDSMQSMATQTGDFDLPPFAKEMLDKAGLTPEDLKNDPELRQKWLQQFQELRGVPTSKRKNSKTKSTPSQSNFYKVIVDNNLFRPLGYKKSKSDPAFQLIATLIDREKGESKALIQSNKDRKIHYVRIGEAFAGAKVKKIEPFKVTLFHDGKSQEFSISRGNLIGKVGGGGPSRPQMSQPPTPNPGANRGRARSENVKSSKDKSSKENEKMMRKMKEDAMRKMKEEEARRAQQGRGRRGTRR